MDDWMWPKVRQSVAERVLSRHQHEQEELAAQPGGGDGRPPQRRLHHHHHHPPHRDRAGSLFISGESVAELMVRPQTRRHSVPAGSQLGGSYDRQRHGSDPDGDWSDSTGLPHERELEIQKLQDLTQMTQSGRSSSPPSLLDAMKNEMRSIHAMEEQRKHLEPDLSSSRRQHPRQATAKSHHRLPLALKEDEIVQQPQRLTSTVRRLSSTEELPFPKLQREETIISTEKFQVLSLDGERLEQQGAAAESGCEPHGVEAPSLETHRSNASSDKERSKYQPVADLRSKHQPLADLTKGATGSRSTKGGIKKIGDKTPKRRHSHKHNEHVAVEFVEDEPSRGPPNAQTRDRSANSPEDLSLPLHLLQDDDDDEGDRYADDEAGVGGSKVGQEEGRRAVGVVKAAVGVVKTDPLQDAAWEQARKCHYIRGFDPPDMRVPEDVVDYVFDRDGDHHAEDCYDD